MIALFVAMAITTTPTPSTQPLYNGFYDMHWAQIGGEWHTVNGYMLLLGDQFLWVNAKRNADNKPLLQIANVVSWSRVFGEYGFVSDRQFFSVWHLGDWVIVRIDRDLVLWMTSKRELAK